MSCPRCRSTRGRQIAPGYIECEGTVQVDRPAPVPGGRYLYDEPCRTRYHLADPADPTPGRPECGCGTLAIRSCRRCGTPLCGDHGRLVAAEGVHDREWWCRRCCDDETERKRLARLDALRPELERIRALPAAGREELFALFHRRGGVQDGVTHHFLHITHRNMAELAHSVLPVVDGKVRMPSGHVLHRDGTLRWIEASQRSMTDGSTAYTPARNEIVGRPSDPWLPQPHLTDPNFPEVLYRDSTERPYTSIEDSLEGIRRHAPGQTEHRRLGHSADRAKQLRLLAALACGAGSVACIIAGVQVLQTATTTVEQNPATGWFVGAFVLVFLTLWAFSSWSTS